MKIYNSYNYGRFTQELKKLRVKHPLKHPLDLMKHLFHGTKQTTPNKVYADEDGFDMRLANNGLNGYGIYFADNSKYSDGYAHKLAHGN